MTAIPLKTPFPPNRTITLSKADKLVGLYRTKGAHWLIEYCHHHNMTRQQMRDFIACDCADPVPKEAA